MNIYETPEGVDQYFEMSEGYDLSHYSDIIQKYLPVGKTLLEVGMGPGNDFLWLSKIYETTGSDYSKEFISRAEKRFSGADLVQLDGIYLDTDRTFDALFSSKVYQHVPTSKMSEVFDNQKRILKKDGLIMHTFWVGGRTEEIDDMVFFYHNTEDLFKLINNNFTVLHRELYTEFEKNDSLFIIARKK